MAHADRYEYHQQTRGRPEIPKESVIVDARPEQPGDADCREQAECPKQGVRPPIVWPPIVWPPSRNSSSVEQSNPRAVDMRIEDPRDHRGGTEQKKGLFTPCFMTGEYRPDTQLGSPC